MRSARHLMALVAAAVVGTGLAACAGPPDAPTAPPQAPTTPSSSPTGAGSGEAPAPDQRSQTVEITVRDGALSGDTGRVEIPLGTAVTLTVHSDQADEIHVHGYDVAAHIPAGGSGSVHFVADIPGVFEAELHESGQLLAQLQVS